MFEKGRSKYKSKPMSDGLKNHKTCCNQLCSCSFSRQLCCWLLKTQIISLIQGKGAEENRDICFPNFKTSEQQLEVFTFPIIRRKRKWCWELCSPANPKIHVIQIQKQLQSHLIKLYPKCAGSQMLASQEVLSQHLDAASNSQTEPETLLHVKIFNISLLTKIAMLEIAFVVFLPQYNWGGKVRLHYQYRYQKKVNFPAHSWNQWHKLSKNSCSSLVHVPTSIPLHVPHLHLPPYMGTAVLKEQDSFTSTLQIKATG